MDPGGSGSETLVSSLATNAILVLLLLYNLAAVIVSLVLSLLLVMNMNIYRKLFDPFKVKHEKFISGNNEKKPVLIYTLRLIGKARLSSLFEFCLRLK